MLGVLSFPMVGILVAGVTGRETGVPILLVEKDRVMAPDLEVVELPDEDSIMRERGELDRVKRSGFSLSESGLLAVGSSLLSPETTTTALIKQEFRHFFHLG